MRNLVVLTSLLLVSTGPSDAGLVEIASAHDVKETVTRLEAGDRGAELR